MRMDKGWATVTFLMVLKVLYGNVIRNKKTCGHLSIWRTTSTTTSRCITFQCLVYTLHWRLSTGVHMKNPFNNSYQDGLGRTTQTLDHVVVVHISIWDKRKSQINEYSDSEYKNKQKHNYEIEDHTSLTNDWHCVRFSNILSVDNNS